MDHILEASLYQINADQTNSENNSLIAGLIGLSSACDKVRMQFSELDTTDISQILTDQGNVKPEHLKEFYELFTELVEFDLLIPIIVCDNGQYVNIVEQLSDSDWQMAYVDRSPYRYLNPNNEKNYNTFIGMQKHHGSEMSQINADKHIRLHEVRYDHAKAEAALRNVDVALIHLDAIRYSDNPGHKGSWPAGLTIEEMCQLSKYIGASHKLKAIVIGGYQENDDVHNIIAKNISLLTYYMVEGISIRKKETRLNHYNTYTVLPDGMDTVLTFRENQQSGRWWILHEVEGEEQLIPCTKHDYEEACVNRITDSIVRLYTLV